MQDFRSEHLGGLSIAAQNSGVRAGRPLEANGDLLDSVSPSDGKVIAQVRQGTVADYERVVSRAREAFDSWRALPAPKRGEIVRQMGLRLREHKAALGQLVAYEMGKILPEGEGEVQEMIDIADFAVGLSRQLYGLTIASERPRHRMVEQWHPLGTVGVITAFNFPVAVWAWNAFIALVCGDTVVWKPSSKTPLCALAVQALMDDVLAEAGYAGVLGLVIGSGAQVGEAMLGDRRLALISATGSSRMGKHVGEAVASRFGRTILELGGNNALVVMDDANVDMALRAVLFGAVGTAGQRCTSTRRLLLQQGIAPVFLKALCVAYEQVAVGDPLAPTTLMGPLIDSGAVDTMMRAIATARAQGGELLTGGGRLQGPGYPSACYVTPAIIKARADMPIVREETFAPILYAISFATLEEAIAIHNDVPQGLSSAIFTESLRSAEHFLSAVGSDCGIANVNIGTSGAEIGGAFGGEKETGGGREAGSDAWKAYMRRQTQTINWSTALPLAQGIQFG